MLRNAFIFIVLLFAISAGWLGYYASTPQTLQQAPIEFNLAHGSTLKGVAKQLTAAGVLNEPWNFVAMARVLGKAGAIKAGNYQLESGLTPLQLLRKITEGDVSQSKLTFIEGWNIYQIRNALDTHPVIRHDTKGLAEQELLKLVGAEENTLEGMIFPDTYYFSNGMSDTAILKRAYRIMQQKLADAWQERAPDLPYATPYEALIMASIIEKETGKAAERPQIAAVFINRLRIGMRLQTDPTVIYGLGQGFDGNLRKRDLTADSAYNTYTRAGLPPTPIAMPGYESIQAALHPAQTKAIYFVAKGNGSHQFSSSLTEHNRAVNQYQRSK
jgi:UPF0755 protein